jgi:hypothetical protein
MDARTPHLACQKPDGRGHDIGFQRPYARSAAFVSGDVSRVVVRGAGPGGADLLARLSAVTNGTTATLNAPQDNNHGRQRAGCSHLRRLNPNVTAY